VQPPPSQTPAQVLTFARTASPRALRRTKAARGGLQDVNEDNRKSRKNKEKKSKTTYLIDLPFEGKQQLLPCKRVPDEPLFFPPVRINARVHAPVLPGQLLDEARLYRAETEALRLKVNIVSIRILSTQAGLFISLPQKPNRLTPGLDRAGRFLL